jgi:hypothetical protein
MRGHWNIDKDSIDAVNSIDGEPLNVGIGIVVPAYKVMEITHQEIVMKMREEAKKLI